MTLILSGIESLHQTRHETVTPANAPHQDGTTPDGSTPDAPDRPGPRSIVLPAGYVAEHVQLGYASTVHAAQGMTVDAAHTVTDGTLDAATLYVSMTRGRLRNTAHVARTPATAAATTDTAPTVDTGTGGHVQAVDHTHRASARVVLEAGLDTEVRNRAATVEAELDTERLSSMTTLAGRHETVTRHACRERLDRHLDQLTHDGTLDEATRARLGADQGTEHLSRLLRAVEQAGGEPQQALAAAVTERRFDDAKSVAQVLSYRITGGEPVPHPTIAAVTDPGTADAVVGDSGDGSAEGGAMATPSDIPGDIAPHAAAHLARLTARLEDRRAVLAARVAADPPPWALTALGPVPHDRAARLDWLARAGTVAGHREATSWDHPDQPIGTMPGLAATERRASHVAAWHALGQPEAGLDASAMTEGRLRIRVRAADLEKAWAPPHADDALRATEIGAETARQAAALAYAAAENATRTGDHDTASGHLAAAAGHDADHALRTAALDPLTVTVTARAAWAAATAVTLDEGTRAATELTRRGLTLGTEPDRTTTPDWLDAHHPDPDPDAAHDAAARAANRARAITTAHQAPDTHDQSQGPGVDYDAVEVEDPAEHDDQPAEGYDPAATPDPRSPEMITEPAEYGWGHSRGSAAAYDVVPVTATLDDLHATAAIAAVALDRAARAHNDRPPTDAADFDDTHTHSTTGAGVDRHDSDGTD